MSSTTILTSSPWARIEHFPCTDLRSIMLETSSEDIKLSPERLNDVMIAKDSVEIDISEDYAIALALQLEEQMTSHTIDYSRLSQVMGNSSNCTPLGRVAACIGKYNAPNIIVSDDVYEKSLRTCQVHRKKSFKSSKKPQKRKVTNSFLNQLQEEDAAEDDPLDRLFNLFFSPFDAFHDVAHEFPFSREEALH